MNLREIALQQMREICLALPETQETDTWGKPHFRVRDKIFAGCGEEDNQVSIGFKLEKPHAAELIEDDPDVHPAKYVGKHGWVSMTVTKDTAWEKVRSYVFESYTLIAPKSCLKKFTPEYK